MLINVTVFTSFWVHHKGLSSDVKATIKERSVHKLTATTREAAGSHLGRRNLNNFVLCSVILGVNDIVGLNLEGLHY